MSRSRAAEATRRPPWAAYFLTAFPVLLAAALAHTPLGDLDFWWHLRAGQWIVQHKAVPRVDVFSYTIPGRPWIAFEWLSQVIFYALYRFGGAGAVVLLKSVLAAALASLMLGYGRSLRVEALAAAGPVVLLAFGAARPTFVERPQLFTYLLTAAFLVLLKAGESRPRQLWTLVPLQLAWANLHGGASILGPALIGAALAGRPRDRRLWAALGACALVSLANPFGWRIYSQLFGTMTFRSRTLINEWSPLRYDARSIATWLPLTALEALSALAWVADPRRRRSDALVGLAFFALSFRAFRFATQAALVFGQLFCGDWAEIARARELRPKAALSALAASLVLSTATAWKAEAASAAFFSTDIWARPDAARAIAFVRENGLKGPLFNSYDLGGQLIWLDPDLPVFVDGRSLEYGPDFVEDALDWFRPEVWERLESTWRFQLAVIDNESAYVCAVLDSDPDWRLVYWDDSALVYVRADGPNAEAAERLGYRSLRPNRTHLGHLDAAFPEEPASVPGLGEELDRSIAAAPGSVLPRLLKIRFLVRTGRLEEALKECAAAAAVSPNRVEPYLISGSIRMSLGRPDEARSDLEEALRRARRLEDPTFEPRILAALDKLSSRDLR